MGYFWKGVSFDDFLIQGFRITSTEEFAGVLLVLMIFSVIYEGVRMFRDVFMDKYLEQKKQYTLQRNSHVEVKFVKDGDSSGDKSVKQIDTISTKTNEVDSNAKVELELQKFNNSGSHFSRVSHLIFATMLHMCHVFLGYTLMLAVMSFNMWILISIALGTGGGFLIFNFLKRSLWPVKGIPRI